MPWNPERPLTQAERDGYDRGNGVISEVDENYVPLRNKANDYLIDRKLQKTKSYTGIKGVSEQDAAVHDSQGRSPIAPRTSRPDRSCILHFRKLVMDCARRCSRGRATASCASGPLRRALRRLRDAQGQGPARGHGRALRRRDRFVGGREPRRGVKRFRIRCHRAGRPANAGTHNPGLACAEGICHSAFWRRHGVWVPAFAGTTRVEILRAESSYNGACDTPDWRGSASSRSRSRSIRRRISSVILPSRSRTWMNFRSAEISSGSGPSRSSTHHACRDPGNPAAGWRGSRAARAAA